MRAFLAAALILAAGLFGPAQALARPQLLDAVIGPDGVTVTEDDRPAPPGGGSDGGAGRPDEDPPKKQRPSSPVAVATMTHEEHQRELANWAVHVASAPLLARRHAHLRHHRPSPLGVPNGFGGRKG